MAELCRRDVACPPTGLTDARQERAAAHTHSSDSAQHSSAAVPSRERARAADGQRGKEHQRAEEQQIKPARGHLSLTGMRTAESTSANACSPV